MTYDVTISASGDLLVAHLAGYGLAWLMHEQQFEVWIRHDPQTQDFDVQVTAHGTEDEVVAAIAESTRRLEAVTDLDIEPGKSGNDRRAVIWSRSSFKGSPERAVAVLRRQRDLIQLHESDRMVSGWLAGLGLTGAWLEEPPGPAGGSTALDGVLGNHTSDFIRGAARRLRFFVAEMPRASVVAALRGDTSNAIPDRTSWSPPGTSVDPVVQWLAVLGLALFPVAQHAAGGRAVTPACWPRGRGVTLPILGEWTSVPRLQALVAHQSLPILNPRAEPTTRSRADSALRAHGIDETVAFARVNKSGSGSSVAFTFGLGIQNKRAGL